MNIRCLVMNAISISLLVLLLPTAILSQDCKDFNKKWINTSCSPESLCYDRANGRQKIEIKKTRYEMECNYQGIDQNAITCSTVKSIDSLTLTNCRFSDVSYWKLVGTKEPATMTIQYKERKPITVDITFSNVIKLSKIVIRNLITKEEFPIKFRGNLKSIRILEINGHSFKKFRKSFRQLASLSNLEIRNGPLEVLKEEILSGLSRTLLILDLARNQIKKIEKKAFADFTILRALYLTGNKIKEIEAGIFSSLHTLAVLALDRNELTSIQINAFFGLNNLETLSISHNPLETLPQFHQPFGPSLRLNVSAQYCRFNHFPIYGYSKTRQLNVDLSNNHITKPVLPICHPSEMTVKLHNNTISTIVLNTSCESITKSPRYYLDKNAPVCDCNLRPFIEFVLGNRTSYSAEFFPNFDLLSCRGTGVSLDEVRIVCPRTDCPSVCKCIDKISDCSNKALTDPPNTIPVRTTIVLLYKNKITSLKKSDPKYWNHVTELNLSNNLLPSLDEWVVPEKLQKLDLRRNRLHRISHLLMKLVEYQSHFEIYLSNNDWHCDCALVVFKEWLMNNRERVNDYDHILCNLSILERGTVTAFIKDAYVDNFCSAMRVDSQIFMVLLPIVLLAILVFTYYYKYTILSLLYSCNVLRCSFVKEPVQDKKYDAFVCSNVADRSLVIQFIRELEPLYRLCIPERDWPKTSEYGTSYHVNQSLKNSRGTIIVVSSSSLQEIWFQVKVRGAYNQRLEDDVHKMILVILGDIRDVPTKHDIREIITKEPCLEWGERWFWQKLHYELRRPR